MPRLPISGQDGDQWGDVLNEFLRVSHNEDGTLRRTVLQSVSPLDPPYAASANATPEHNDSALAAFVSDNPGALADLRRQILTAMSIPTGAQWRNGGIKIGDYVYPMKGYFDHKSSKATMARAYSYASQDSTFIYRNKVYHIFARGVGHGTAKDYIHNKVMMIESEDGLLWSTPELIMDKAGTQEDLFPTGAIVSNGRLVLIVKVENTWRMYTRKMREMIVARNAAATTAGQHFIEFTIPNHGFLEGDSADVHRIEGKDNDGKIAGIDRSNIGRQNKIWKSDHVIRFTTKIAANANVSNAGGTVKIVAYDGDWQETLFPSSSLHETAQNAVGEIVMFQSLKRDRQGRLYTCYSGKRLGVFRINAYVGTGSLEHRGFLEDDNGSSRGVNVEGVLTEPTLEISPTDDNKFYIFLRTQASEIETANFAYSSDQCATFRQQALPIRGVARGAMERSPIPLAVASDGCIYAVAQNRITSGTGVAEYVDTYLLKADEIDAQSRLADAFDVFIVGALQNPATGAGFSTEESSEATATGLPSLIRFYDKIIYLLAQEEPQHFSDGYYFKQGQAAGVIANLHATIIRTGDDISVDKFIDDQRVGKRLGTTESEVIPWVMTYRDVPAAVANGGYWIPTTVEADTFPFKTFDPATGYFDPPKTGIYQFIVMAYWEAKNGAGVDVYLELVDQSDQVWTPIWWAYTRFANNQPANPDDQARNAPQTTAFIKLLQGKKVRFCVRNSTISPSEMRNMLSVTYLGDH